MTAGAAETSLTQHVLPVDAGAHVTAVGWLRDTAAFALADGAVLLAKDGEAHRVAAHPDGAVLVAAGDGRGMFLTGGDDGRVAVTGPDGATRTLAETGGAWIDALALHANGGFAYSAGKRVVARDDKGREKTLEAPSTARGLAFAPKATGWRWRTTTARRSGSRTSRPPRKR